MSRYEGYSDPLEALVNLLKEQRRTNELLEQLIQCKNPVEAKAETRRGKVKGDVHADKS